MNSVEIESHMNGMALLIPLCKNQQATKHDHGIICFFFFSLYGEAHHRSPLMKAVKNGGSSYRSALP